MEHRDLLGERVALLACDVSRDVELRPTEPFEELSKFRRCDVSTTVSLEELPGNEGRFVSEQNADVRTRTKCVFRNQLLGLIELAQESLVAEVVHLRELRQPVDRDDDPGAELTRMLTPNELAG